MPLTEYERTTIASTITGYISDIPVHTVEDFDHLVAALQTIISPDNQTQVVEKMQHRVNSITNYMDPDFILLTSEKLIEFNKLCYEIISQRIKYFSDLNPAEKEHYIQEQISRKKEVQKSQEKMAASKPPEPGSDAHTEPEGTWLTQLMLAENTQGEGYALAIHYFSQAIEIQYIIQLHQVYQQHTIAEYTTGATRQQEYELAIQDFSQAMEIQYIIQLYAQRGWQQTANNWEQDSTDDRKYFKDGEANRFKIYQKHPCKCVNTIGLCKFTDDTYGILLKAGPDFAEQDIDDSAALKYALLEHGVYTAHITQFASDDISDPSNIFSMKATYDEISSVMGKILDAVEEVEGGMGTMKQIITDAFKPIPSTQSSNRPGPR